MSRMWSYREHGPLPPVLLGTTVVTGLVDAVSILELGRVFVANMTGNVVFVAFALAGSPGFSLSASLFALVGFLVGAGAGGTFIHKAASDRALLLRDGAAVELVLLAAALAIVAHSGTHLDAPTRNATAGLLATGMGIQNAVARQFAVPDLTTTVLTMTLTGIAADVRSKTWGAALARRFLSVVAMFAGAIAGAALALHGKTAVDLSIAVGILAAVTLVALLVANRPGEWRTASAN